MVDQYNLVKAFNKWKHPVFKHKLKESITIQCLKFGMSILRQLLSIKIA